MNLRPPESRVRAAPFTRDAEIARASAHERARALFDGPRGGLYLFGPPGSGKTTLARALLRELQDRGTPGHFVHFERDVLQALRNTYSRRCDRSEGVFLGELCEAPVLVLDDLGSHRDTEWSHRVLYDVIDARYEARRLIIIASRELREAWAGRFGGRVYSRLCEMTEQVVLDRAVGPKRFFRSGITG